MNTQVFSSAKSAYAVGKYEDALQLLTQCLEDETTPPQPGEVGLLYHQIGNCLVKLGNHNEAIRAYTQATADVAYGACGSVNYNLGMAYAALGDFEDAISHFEIAVSDGKYDTPYKAYLAMGNAMMKLGKSAEAGIAFRAAALDEHNPNPARALLNLGVCFMALNRPNDAVVSYESALQFDMDASLKNKLYANLGQAYMASGQAQKACHAFEEALSDKTYRLSDSASVDYQRAVSMLAQGTSELGLEVRKAIAETEVEPKADEFAKDASGLDVMNSEPEPEKQEYSRYSRGSRDYSATPMTGDSGYDDGFDPGSGYGVEEEDDPRAAKAKKAKAKSRRGKNSYGDDQFFADDNRAEEQWNKLSNAAPKKRRIGLKIAIFFLVLLIAALGVGIWFYTQGWGSPSQEDVVTDLFADPDNAKDTLFAEGINDATAAQLVAQIFQDKNVSIDGVNKSMSTSEVYATTTMLEGGKITYKITLIRDMLSWKISNIEIYHQSKA